MQYLIATADRSLDDAKRGALVDFVRVKKNEVNRTEADQAA